MANPNGTDLLQRWRDGDEDAATAIYERYAEPLAHVVSQHIAKRFRARFEEDDVVNSLLGTFLRRARDGQFTVETEGDLWSLLVTIGLNKVRRRIRREQAEMRNPQREASLNVPGGYEEAIFAAGTYQATPEDIAACEEILQLLSERLSPSERVIWHDRLDGHTYGAIALRTGFSEKTVQRVLNNRIPGKVREWFPECLAEENGPTA